MEEAPAFLRGFFSQDLLIFSCHHGFYPVFGSRMFPQGWLIESETSPSLHFLRQSWNFTKMCKRKAAPSPDFPPPEG